MEKAKFIGIKHVKGNKKSNGQPFEFTMAGFLIPMEKRDIDNGSVGQDVKTPSIPERYASLLSVENIGKDFNVEFFYSNGYCNIAYLELLK